MYIFSLTVAEWRLCIKEYVAGYPLGLNLFFQPGLGPGFFLILGSSGTFGLPLLLIGMVISRALGKGEKRSTNTEPGLLSFHALFPFSEGTCSLKDICTHLLSENGLNNSSSDSPPFPLSSKSSSETTLHTFARTHTHTHKTMCFCHCVFVHVAFLFVLMCFSFCCFRLPFRATVQITLKAE